MAIIEKLEDRNLLWNLLKLYVSKRGLKQKIRKGLRSKRQNENFSIDDVMASLETKSYPPSYITSLDIKHFFDYYLHWSFTNDGYKFWLKEQILFSSMLYQLCPTDIVLVSYVVEDLVGRFYGRQCLSPKYLEMLIILYSTNNRKKGRKKR